MICTTHSTIGCEPCPWCEIEKLRSELTACQFERGRLESENEHLKEALGLIGAVPYDGMNDPASEMSCIARSTLENLPTPQSGDPGV